jgi:hypothetical protein
MRKFEQYNVKLLDISETKRGNTWMIKLMSLQHTVRTRTSEIYIQVKTDLIRATRLEPTNWGLKWWYACRFPEQFQNVEEFILSAAGCTKG